MKLTFVVAAASVAIFAGASDAETIPERLIEDLRADFGFEDFQAAGITGNLARETGNFRYMQEIKPLVAGSRGGIGYAQWTGPRRVAFEEWAEDGVDFTDYEVNYGFLKYELETDYTYVVDEILQTTSAEEAAEVFMRRFLIPSKDHAALDIRIDYAVAHMAGDFTGAGCQSTHEVMIDGRMMIVETCDATNAIASNETVTVVAWEGPNGKVEFDPAAFNNGMFRIFMPQDQWPVEAGRPQEDDGPSIS